MSVESRDVSHQRSVYDEYWSEQGFNPDQAILPGLRRLLERTVDPGDSCLDVGCGRGGGPASWVAAHSAAYVGVDVSRTAVEAARAAGLRAEVVEDAAQLPFDDGSFDLVVCIEVLEHLVEPEATVTEIRRVLRAGGRLLVSVPNVAYWRRRLDMLVFGRWNPMGDEQSAHRPWRDPHLRFFGRRNLVRMLREGGFDVVESGGYGASWMVDVPGIRRLMRRRDPGPLYRQLVRAAPAVFAHHLHAVSVKPGPGQPAAASASASTISD